MSYEHQPGTPIVRFDIGGMVTDCHVNNAIIFEHSEQEEGNHIFAATGEIDGALRGRMLWREYFVVDGEEDKYSLGVARLRQIGCSVIESEYMAEEDARLFEQRFGRKPAIRDKELPVHELTQREENRVAFLGYILQNGLLVPNDFQGQGMLYI